MLAEEFEEEGAFLGEFVGVVEDLPGGGGEEVGIFGGNAILGGGLDVEGDAFLVLGFAFGDLKTGDGFAREGVPEEDFLAGGESGESLTTGDEGLDLEGGGDNERFFGHV